MVFRDFSSDGTKDPGDGGQPGMTVKAFNDGDVLVGQATTDADGAWVLTVPSRVRLEVSGITNLVQPAGHGAQNRTTVSFADPGDCDVRVGVNDPFGYCQNNPNIAITCFVEISEPVQLPTVHAVPVVAEGTTASNKALGPPEYAQLEDGVPTLSDPPTLAVQAQTGSVFAISNHRAAGKVYTSAFQKRHARYGAGGTGAIYQIDKKTNAVSVWLDLNAVFGAGFAGTDPHPMTGYPATFDSRQEFFFYDSESYAAAGKISLGAMDTTPDESLLYVMNLKSKELVEIPIDSSGAAPAAGSIKKYTVPNNCAVSALSLIHI